MKLLIAIFSLFVLGSASDMDFENFQIVDTEFLEGIAWAHQNAAHAMQTEVDEEIAGINGLLARALENGTNAAISQYSTHATQVFNVYQPVNTQAQALADSDCKTDTFTLLDFSVLSSGTASGNCITSFNRNLQLEVDAARLILGGIELDFGRLPLFVYQGHARYNIMTEAEFVENYLNSTYAQLKADWDALRPDISTLRSTLAANIQALNTRLGQCFTTAFNFANTMVGTIQTQIAECNEFNANRASKAGAKANIATPFRSHMPELQQMSNDFHFEW